MKIGCNKLWILKEDDSMLYDLSEYDCKMDHSCTYGLQEDFVADQLFQTSEHALDDLIWTDNSIFALMKDQLPYFISSIFLRRLLQPGVYQSTALHATLLDHKKYLSDYEFQSLSIAGLKKEIFMIIESEGAAKNSSSLVYYWKNLCTRFFRYWCQNSTPYGLLVDSSNEVIGLIRKSSFSVFRSIEDIEQLMYGSSDGCSDLKLSGLIDSLDCNGSELLSEVLRCTNYINHQLGRAATSIFYEALVNPIISSDDIISQLLKILETGSSSSMSTVLISQVGVDTTWEKKQTAHKSQRKFSVDMFLSLCALRAKATTWTGVLDVIEKYLKYLYPRKSNESIRSEGIHSINSFLLVQATSQVARVIFESAFDVLLFLGYLVNICGQVDMMQDDVARIKLKLIPMIQEIITQWLILHYLGTSPTTPTVEDFSSRLSSLHIGSKGDKRSLVERLGSSDFTLACLLGLPRSDEGHNGFCSIYFPKPREFIFSVRKFCSLIVWGEHMEESPTYSTTMIEIASLLLRHGQFEAAENLLLILDSYSSKRKASFSAQSGDGDWCARLHLLGFCFLVRAHNELHGVLKEQRIREAVRCFFRAASGQESLHTLQNISFQTGFQYSGDSSSAAELRLHYYQWAMQIFEQYGMSEAACQFCLAALDQVDEVLRSEDVNDDEDHNESATTIRGRLWANVFKFSLDLRHYRDAYCAITSNPDEDSKSICLRRFIIVLCEQGATKVLCDGTLPFVGLTEKVEQELFWKAERSDIYAKPNLYRLLYAFEAYRNNWRKAATYMYRYSVRLKVKQPPI
ncbi:nuclear pore complex protein NUP160 [Iris pallida]|uniref:Nuclear pore complex protein NUP160 n=1 Tax=Iris pallida TaxID=29817 RepID=A0AAX6H3W9_IRIPA|nr:nuclear pore complex protein NUP160 [Iris pallida]